MSDYSIQLHLVWINLSWLIFPSESPKSRKLTLNIRDVEVIDNIKSSNWRKFLGFHTPEAGMAPRETGSDMVKLNWTGFHESDGEEFILNLKVLPIRMYIDQDALLFFVNFFKSDANDFTDQKKRRTTDAADTVFFRICSINPISVKVDYKAKKIDFESIKEGKYAEFINFVNLDGASLHLQSVKLYGVKGWQKLFDKLFSIWVPHVRKTQVPSLASGIGGIKTLVNVGSGMKDLVSKPVTQYKKDGRIIKGEIQIDIRYFKRHLFIR